MGWVTRDVISLSGADAEPLLQSVLTNDVAKASEDRLVYAALLTPQGKWLHDMIVVRDAGALLLYVRPEESASLMQRLMMYKLRSEVVLEKREQKAMLGEVGLPDPRVAALGSWQLVEGAEQADEAAYTAHRIAHAVPESGVDMIENTLAMEAGLEALHGVDFAKGCYVGQEVTTRSKFRGKVRKMLSVVAVQGAEAGQQIRNEKDVVVGDIRSVGDGQAMAMLRLDAQESTLKAGGNAVTFERVVGA